MGVDESIHPMATYIPGTDYVNVIKPMSTRTQSLRSKDFVTDDETLSGSGYRKGIVQMGYNGYWSIMNPVGRGPAPRTGQFTAYSKKMHTLFIGYGQKKSGRLLNDVWALDCLSFAWRKIPLSGVELEPRTGATACMMDHYIVVFGGCSSPHFFADLHTIDVFTGEVMMAETQGHKPHPRIDAIIGIHRKQLYITGGYSSSEGMFSLYVMPFATMTWKKIKMPVPGRRGRAFAQFNNRIFAYGTNEAGNTDFVVVDMDSQNVTTTQTSGSAPPPEVSNAAMVKVGQYAFYFGGNGKNDNTLVYACNIPKLWWFVFFVAPDGTTTSTSEGYLTNEGLFMLPKTEQFSACYVPEKRSIVATLGTPYMNPAPLSILSLAEALAFLNLREDMTEMFYVYTSEY